MHSTEIIARIRAFRGENNLSRSGLATKAGLHKNALRNLDDPDWNPSLDTVQKLERFIGEPVEAAQ